MYLSYKNNFLDMYGESPEGDFIEDDDEGTN
jgi:hypothetical protein